MTPLGFRAVYRWHVVPVAQPRSVFLVYDGDFNVGEMPVKIGPFEIIALAVVIPEIIGPADLTDHYTNKNSHYQRADPPREIDSGHDCALDYAPTYVLVTTDEECPWVQIDNDAFFTEEGADRSVHDRWERARKMTKKLRCNLCHTFYAVPFRYLGDGCGDKSLRPKSSCTGVCLADSSVKHSEISCPTSNCYSHA